MFWLAGGDLLATLTSTFDQKMKSLVGTSKSISSTTKTPTSTLAGNMDHSTSTSVTRAKKPISSTSAATGTSTPMSKKEEDKLIVSTCNAPERLHLLNCDDDIPFADTDTTELEVRAPQPPSQPVNVHTPVQSSSAALLSYRDPSLHRASRILRSSTVSWSIFISSLMCLFDVSVLI